MSGQPFCSKEHRELYLNTQSKDAIKRLLSSFSEEGEPVEPVAPATPSPAEPLDLAPIEAPADVAVVAKPVAQPEPPRIAPDADQDPPEGPFLRQSVPDPRNRPVALISRTITEPFSGQVELPSSPGPEPLAVEPASTSKPVEAEPEPPAASLAPLELDVAPVDVPDDGPRWSAPTERQAEEPSIVPAPVTRIVVLEEPGLLSLPMLEGHAPQESVPDPESKPHLVAQPSPPALVRLDAQPEAATRADGLTPPPPAPARAIWPEQKQASSVPPPVVPVGALRPRSSGARAPSRSGSHAAVQGLLGRAGATRELQPAASRSGSPNAEVVLPLLPESVELCAPSPLEVDERQCSLASPVTLLPFRLSPPIAETPRTAFESTAWRLAVGVPRLPDVAGAFSNIRQLAGLATFPSSTATNQPPTFQSVPPITRSLPVRVPPEAVQPACLPPTLPLSAEALPSPKPSTRELPFRPPAPDFRPSLPKAAERAKLPSRASGSVPPAKLSTAGRLAFQFSLGIAAPSLTISGLGQEIHVAPALPGGTVEPRHLTPVFSAATHEIASLPFINRTEAADIAAPLASGAALRSSAPVAATPPSNTLAAPADWLTIELTATLRFPLPAELAIPAPIPVSTSVNPHWPRTVSASTPFALRSSANIRPLWWDEALVKTEWKGQPESRRLSRLEAARPSPLSLLTAPRAVPLSASVTTLSRFEQPRVAPWNLMQGQAVSVPLFSQATSGRRVALPCPDRPRVSFALPGVTDADPLHVESLPPASAGIEQIPMGAGRIQPASLPVLPGSSRLPRIDSAAGLRVSGTLVNAAKQLVSAPPRQTCLDWEIHPPVVNALPWTAPQAYSPALCPASFGEGLSSGLVAPPAAQPREISVLSSRQRLARALSSGFRSLLSFAS
ncbi:MAG TPA: hypothetical protein VMH80_27580 [Bryobacteraceae bacterium]|nr:hypothetical protein [Bryobacteraceae bacterium]